MLKQFSPWPAHFLLMRGIFSITLLLRLIRITWWEEIAVQNVNFGKFIFILRTLNKTVIRILTQNDVNFKRKLFHRKVATAENTDQVAQVHWSLVRNYTACPAMLFFYKKKQHDQKAHEYTRWPECLHCLRIRVECANSGDWSAITSMKCFQIILKKM